MGGAAEKVRTGCAQSEGLHEVPARQRRQRR